MTSWSAKTTYAGGDLKVGTHLDNNTALWCIWDNIQIQYYGPIDLSSYVTELANAVSAAQAYESQLPDAVYANIASVITANNKSYETSDEYSAAITAINNAVSTYVTAAIVADYARYQNVKTAATSIASGLDTSTADTEVEAATTTADIDAAITTLRAAFLAELPNVTIPAAGYIDVTAVMVDNASVRFNTDYWTITNVSDPGWNSSAGVCNYEECEFYSRNFKFYQTLALTPGTWEFGVTGFHRAGNHNTHFYAGVDKILIPGVESSVVNTMAEAKTYFDNGNGKVALQFLIEEAQDVEIGIDNQDTETDRWTIFRDFTLKYYGAPDYTVYENQWSALVAEAEAAKTAHANVTGTELTALNEAIADSPAGSNLKATYIEKIGALEDALQAFNAAAPAYDKYVAYKAETEALWGTDFEVAAPTTAAEATAAVQNLNIAQYNKVDTDYPYSLTSKIGDFSTWTGTAQVGTPRVDGTPNSLDWEHWSGTTHPYYEQDGNGYNNAGGWTIQYTKTTTLAAGDYVVKVAARSSAGVTSNITITANDAEIAPVISLPCVGNRARGINTDGEASWSDDDTFILENQGGGWEWRFVPFTLDAETTVTMTFYAEASTQSQWMSIGDGELLCTENLATDVAYSEDVDNTIVDVDPANVTITRNVKVGYNTVVLPFDITIVQMEAAFGTGAEVYTFSENSASANSVELNFTKNNAGTISANVPVLVKATAASTEQTFNGVQVVASTSAVQVEGKYVDYVGVYAPTTLAAGDFFIATKDNIQQVFQSQGNNDKVNGFRAYFKAKEADGGNVKAALFIDGVATSISEINGEAATVNGAIYNLAGQRVNKAQKGIFIVNGKKVILK